MNPRPTFNLSGLDTPISEHTLILVGDDRVSVSMRASGSAVLIGPRLALTARHVIDDLWLSLTGTSEMPSGSDPLTADFQILALQFLASPDNLAVWRVEKLWRCSHSDLSILALSPFNDTSLSYRPTAQLTLRASPPLKGSRVAAFGFYGSIVEAVSREPDLRVSWGLNPASTEGSVLNAFEVMRDRSFLNFPCYEINARFEGGMSGGPVFNDAGELCGIVCASLNPGQGVSHIAYAATLWPAFGVLIDFQAPDLIVRGPYNLAELGGLGYLHLRGWDELVSRITIVQDEFGHERLALG